MSDVSQWWATQIIDMEPGKIELRGQSVQSLIRGASFVETLWLMVMGSPPSPGQSRILEAALVAGVDHGPQAPSIAAARMASTCGVGLNNAMATGVNMLGDVHGGAGQQALELYQSIHTRLAKHELSDAVEFELSRYPDKHIPGFGHRYHKPEDPRSGPLFEILREHSSDETVDHRFADIAECIQRSLSRGRNPGLAINIDGATAALYGAIGVPAPLARGFFCLSRSVGILAHSWEQMEQGGRNKGPTPPHYRWDYRAPHNS